MRKYFLSSVLALGFTAVVVAQKKGDVEFGFNVGYNNSTISNSDVSADSAIGFNIGGAVDYYFQIVGVSKES